jgi:hypothetical protein
MDYDTASWVDVRSVAEECAVCMFRVDLEVKAVCSSETL